MEVLLVEDSTGDIRLTQEAFREVEDTVHFHIARDGVEAMDFLMQRGDNARSPRPDFILLDLNLPKTDGREVLALIKDHESLKSIPTIILTTSDAEADILKSYKLRANCYLTKPFQLEAFEAVVNGLKSILADEGQIAKSQRTVS
jgi:CheY-like chemotaxis protein